MQDNPTAKAHATRRRRTKVRAGRDTASRGLFARSLRAICTDPAWESAVVALPPQFVPPALPGTHSIHRHDHWELKMVLEGRMGVREPGGVRQYAAPAFLLFPPRWQHSHTADAEAAGAASWLVVAAGPDTVDFSIKRGARVVARHSLTDAQRRRVLDLLPGGTFDPFLQSVATSLAHGPARLAGLHAAATLRCLFHAVRLALATDRPHPVPRTTAEAIHREMDARYYDPELRVRDIAHLLKLSQGELSRRYKRETGTTIRQALVRLRLERARALLQQGMRVKETALVTGWSTQHHFSNTFCKRLGIRPSAIRRPRGQTVNNDCVEKPPVFEKTLKIGEAKHKGSFIKIDPRAILARSFSHVMRREGFSTQSNNKFSTKTPPTEERPPDERTDPATLLT